MRQILVSVAGKDAPGITATLTGIIADASAALLDIEQVVVRGQATIMLLIGVEGEQTRGSPVVRDLLFAAKELGLELDFKVQDEVAIDPTAAEDRPRYAVTVIGDAIDARLIHEVSAVLLEHHANIEVIRRLSERTLASLEVEVSLPPGASRSASWAGGPPGDDDAYIALRKALMALAVSRGVDIALQRETLTRRSKRLVVMDMDSTLIQIEVIDELARAYGVYDAVAEITHRAMNGAMNYEESLKARVALLAGMPMSLALDIANRLPVTDGAEELLRVLRGLGYKTAVISGGFSFAAEVLRQRLGLDYAYSNQLEVKDGRLTGRVFEPIVGPQRKADLLDALAQREGIPLEQTIAIGDGANDLLMLEKAGLGIAFHAKPRLREAADTSLSSGGLDRILYLLGLRARDVRELPGVRL
ncbi:MAG: phosphoserine phosphatase SerB [Myxococcales bacterium]|nr:phosphoserine phosphatase SerB [Myxococcales bacterium]